MKEYVYLIPIMAQSFLLVKNENYSYFGRNSSLNHEIKESRKKEKRG